MPTLALIGDSHTQAIWPLVKSALSATHSVVLQEANPGWSEATYRQKMPDLPARLAAARPEIVAIELGGNGTKTGDAYAEDVRWLVSAAKDAGASRIIWYGPATTAQGASDYVRDRHEQIADEQSRLLPSLGVEWHDSRPLTLTDQRSDGVHFTNTGYRRWADDVVKSILTPPGILTRVFSGKVGGMPKAALVAGTVGISALLVVVALRMRGKI